MIEDHHPMPRELPTIPEEMPLEAEYRVHEAMPGDFPHETPHRYGSPFYDPQEHYAIRGFAYGADPLERSLARYGSFPNLPTAGSEDPDPAYTTPAPRRERERERERDRDPARPRERQATSGKSDKKRKRQPIEDLDLSRARAPPEERDEIMTDAPATIHSGLTGGLNRLLMRPDFPPSPDYSGGDGAEPSPMSPLKRTRHHRYRSNAGTVRSENHRDRGGERDSKPRKTSGSSSNSQHADRGDTRSQKSSRRRRSSRSEHGGETSQHHRDHHRRRRRRSGSSSPEQERRSAPRPLKAIEYRPSSASAEPSANAANQIVLHAEARAPVVNCAELFMSFVTKGPESGKGYSMNKALKRYHREMYRLNGKANPKADDEKDLWKALRLKRNDRGEIVLFA
ncbi:hypothetical protein BDY21DRAFT_42437 [Lineolata rhizophorae]|uniref:Uncharacterized protein n=1 Tax=Lineolata rhizophorae TaxID=578093 RepID=A0A6A6NY69_9PEZI|nr:hypothetical protein BDY21DRAFT_42437 [Lineolata rhizophorae]